MPSNEETPQAKLDRLIATNNTARGFSSSTVMSAGSKWTDLETDILVLMRAMGKTHHTVAVALRRSDQACRLRFMKLDLADDSSAAAPQDPSLSIPTPPATPPASEIPASPVASDVSASPSASTVAASQAPASPAVSSGMPAMDWLVLAASQASPLPTVPTETASELPAPLAISPGMTPLEVLAHVASQAPRLTSAPAAADP